MTYNTLTTLSFKLNKDNDININKELIINVFNNIEYIYSYIIKSNLENDKVILVIKFTVSENNKHNTIKVLDMINEILKLLIMDIKINDVISYKQPNLDIIFEVYNRFIMKIAKKHSTIWNLEFDDTYQICALSVVKLYNKNYFLNKYIIEKTCKNDILYSIRKNINKPIIESLDANINTIENITYSDIIKDEKYEYDFEEKINKEATEQAFKKIKEILIKRFGERKFEKFYKDYTNNHTDSISLTMMYKIKVYLKERNITLKLLEGENENEY